MARIFKDKKGKVIKTEPHTKPHPRPCARDADGKRLNKPLDADQVAKPAKVAKPAAKAGDKK